MTDHTKATANNEERAFEMINKFLNFGGTRQSKTNDISMTFGGDVFNARKVIEVKSFSEKYKYLPHILIPSLILIFVIMYYQNKE